MIFDNARFFRDAIKMLKPTSGRVKSVGRKNARGKILGGSLSFVFLLAYTRAGFAGNYPNKSIRLIVSFAAG